MGKKNYPYKFYRGTRKIAPINSIGAPKNYPYNFHRGAKHRADPWYGAWQWGGGWLKNAKTLSPQSSSGQYKKSIIQKIHFFAKKLPL